MIVSICILAYQHGKYITQCLDTVLMQKTAFKYEVLIGEDGSSDGTRDICVQYSQRFPDKIRLFQNNRENVIYINGRPTGRWNFINLLKNARGKYISICEGDDFWLSPYKLQKQYDLLEKNANYSFCFHNALVVHAPLQTPDGRYGPAIKKSFYTTEDLLYQNFIPSCSVFFRNNLFGEFPDWYWNVPMGDWPLHILNSQYGNIGYLDEDLACFRIHDKGMWHSRSLADQLTDIAATYGIFADLLNANQKYVQIIEKMRRSTYARISNEYMRNNDLEKGRYYYEKSLQ